MDVLKGIIYRHPFLYNILGKFYFRKRWNFRYQEVIKYINPGESVLELCAGEGTLNQYLHQNEYLGFEFNRNFVDYGIKKKRNLVLADILSCSFPESDVVVMISSFYHFIHNAKILLDKMKNSCAKRIIICENVNCLSTSKNKQLNTLGKTVSMACNETGGERWDQDKLSGFLKSNSFNNFYYKKGYIFGVWDRVHNAY